MRKKGNGFLVGLLLVVLMAAIITGSLFAGYKFLRYIDKDAAQKIDEVVKDVEEKTGIEFPSPETDPDKKSASKGQSSKKPYEYTKPNERAYDGTRLYESYSYIYNDKGEVLTNFAEKDCYGLDVRFDADRKHGIFMKYENCYLVNADLSFKQIASKCSYAGISFDGTYAYYYSSAAGLWLYNIETGEETLVSETGYRPCISPDGKTLAYYVYSLNGEKGLCIGGIGREETIIDSCENGFYTPYAVSNDGKTVYYIMSSGNDNGFYCINNNKPKRLISSYPYDCYFDRECKKVIYNDSDSAYYYDTDCKEPVLLTDASKYMDIMIYGAEVCRLEMSGEWGIVDTDSFSDVAMILAGDYTFCLEGKTPSVVCLREDGYAAKCDITADGPVCVYRDRDTGNYIKASYKDGKVEIDENFMEASVTEEFEFYNDFTEGYFSKFEMVGQSDYTHKLYYYKDGEEPVCISDLGKNSFECIRWDNLFKKCYYISDGELYSINEKGTVIKLDMDNCDNFTFITFGDDAVHFEDSKNNEYLIVDGNIFEL